MQRHVSEVLGHLFMKNKLPIKQLDKIANSIKLNLRKMKHKVDSYNCIHIDSKSIPREEISFGKELQGLK